MLGNQTLNTYRNINLGTSGVVVATAPAGNCLLVGGWDLANGSNSPRFVKIYDVFAGATPASTDTPRLTIMLAANSKDVVGFGAGLEFTSALGLRATVNVADNDTVAPNSNDVIVNLFYR